MPVRPSLLPLLAPLARLRWPLGGNCQVCRRWSDHGAFCLACVQRHAPLRVRCDGCAVEVPGGVRRCGACLRQPPPQSRTVAALDYAFPWDGLIHRFKYRDAPELARPFADRLFGALETAWATGLARPDLLLPVPLTRSRLRERGYNQAWELTRRIGRRAALPARVDLLARVLDGPSQQGHSREQRLRQVHGAYAVASGAAAPLKGRRVALIDDVMTTGATAESAAGTLLRAGAAEVQVWVLARTPDHP